MCIGLIAVSVVGMALFDVPADRIEKLGAGVSAELAFEPKASTRWRQDQLITADDAAQLARAGFRNVRLVISPINYILPTGAALDDRRVGALVDEVGLIERAGLAVVVAPKLPPNISSEAVSKAYEDFLTDLSTRFARSDASSTFFETSADPPKVDNELWKPLQNRFLLALRKQLPNHTILVIGGVSDTPADLVSMGTYDDQNVVYAFKFFEPKIFTGQLTPGGIVPVGARIRIPYPATPADIVSLMPNQTDTLKVQLKNYADAKWDAVALAAAVRPVAEWARAKRVRVVVDAFGVSASASPQDRARYLQDFRAALLQESIGWCLWGYTGPYGVYTGASGNRQGVQDVLTALGLSG